VDSSDITSIIISSVAILSVLTLLSFWVQRRTKIKKIEVETRAATVNDERLRQLAERAVAAENATVQQMGSLQETLVDLQRRLATIEKLLRDVDA
jgi:hypothetical protein